MNTPNVKNDQAAVSASILHRLVVILSPISRSFRDIGEVVIMIATFFVMIPLFALTAKNWDETMGEWHLRTFGKTLRERADK